MISTWILRLRQTIQHADQLLPRLLGFPGSHFPPPGVLAVVGVEGSNLPASNTPKNPFSLRDLIGDGILWAVPKHRRTIEKRLKRKYGTPEYKSKIFLPKTHLRVCSSCGSDYEVGVLCPTCYKKVRDETEQIQDKIQAKLGLNPVDKEVVVLYDREKDEHSEEFWQGKRIVEMEKSRPVWFSKNLLQRSTQQPAETAELKPESEKLG
ncbi:39S ribosomal protein L32, mitochondrial [Toxorhynchites rutilus septentrionalis]|uniref:39S ribosomal protein L32, mitochondrial n=1 Tax=Toxorhynchites rutilus septentrionalis TaxID=329112 RepID=UPI00247AB8FD|nr:39S ribosomal protein L32, mitochondrial [Toxorhynchites rutilus septentrionalis]